MGHSVRDPILFLFLSVSAFIGAPCTVLADGPIAFEQEIRGNLTQILEDRETATTLEQLSEKAQLPDNAFETTRKKNNPGAWQALGRGLDDLRPDRLALFEEEIRKESQNRDFPNAKHLLDKIIEYWKKTESALVARHDRGQQRDLGNGVPLPSLEHEIDASQSPILNVSELADGEIALTFDDGPHPTRTHRILDTLRAYGVRATFFQVGEMVVRHPHVSQAVAADHHSVGSHSWNHAKLTALPRDSADANIRKGQFAIESLLKEVAVPFFRFPYGARNKTIQRFAQEQKLATFFWNIDSLDWKTPDAVQLFQNVMDQIHRKRRGIVLFHDIREQTAIVLPHVLEALQEGGFKTVVFVPSRNSTQLP
jgi:peptidoglycan/xylan/chitin deacetylase (PgdA/CDA1 family)